jgi:hypothetical protein
MSWCSPFAFLMVRPVVMRAIASMSVSPSEEGQVVVPELLIHI